MPDNLFKPRMNEDISRRSYYGKFIFNSHFLIFLTIAAGVFLYTLLGALQAIEYSIWLDITSALIMSMLVIPGYRSLLKQADGLFLLPYEKRMGGYFKKADRYSLSLSIMKPVTGGAVTILILFAGHNLLAIIIFVIISALLYKANFHIRKNAINTDLSNVLLLITVFVMNILSLSLVLQHVLWVILPVILTYLISRYVRMRSHKILDWNAFIEHEETQLNRYYGNVSMFTNVSHVDKQFKRRKYLDRLLWKPKGRAFNKENMYEFLFHRTFARDHDLPMIILRLIIIFAFVMFWVANIYLSVIIALFGIYIIVLQMSQIYTAQAYLLWPKIWPVKREYIQRSYVTYSHKLVFVISLIFAIIFTAVHPIYFYAAAVFPLWGYLINRVLSKAVYKKEQELSD